MNIDPQNNANNIYAQNLGKTAQTGSAKQAAESGATPATESDMLQLNALDALRSEPEIRPDVVAKGKELLNDPNFPSQEMVNEMAKLIVPFADEQ
ncbi:hypothetical protein [Pelagicoccus albus]|uniref:Uncharacterized protein n=1 Tax=Pelagicoccus albus TaxID=415222 RepID=A0A7X1E7Z2_9BACT|nr:hypothetical protein [Pelagicoccus albus]MBC2605779.1 hypothetical protein [Pelagicoccus albus]